MKGQEVYLILHNIRSAYNVGSIFRTADTAGVNRIYVCGHSPTPDNKKVAKTALGAEKTVPWEYRKQTWRLLGELKKNGVQIVALEQVKKSVDYRKFKPRFPLALIVGHERKGLNKIILSRTDKIIEIPMCGKKESLNVAVATGIAIFKILEHKKEKTAPGTAGKSHNTGRG